MVQKSQGQPPAMYPKTRRYNNGDFPTFPSTGESARFLNHQRYSTKAPMTWIFAAVTGSNHVLINRNNLQGASAPTK